jgi:hypothetical protein
MLLSTHVTYINYFCLCADGTPPLLALPGSTIFVQSAASTAVRFDARATDNLEPNPKVTCTPKSGASFSVGKTTVTCTATDKAGNAKSGTFDVVVGECDCVVTRPRVTRPCYHTYKGPLVRHACVECEKLIDVTLLEHKLVP